MICQTSSPSLGAYAMEKAKQRHPDWSAAANIHQCVFLHISIRTSLPKKYLKQSVLQWLICWIRPHRSVVAPHLHQWALGTNEPVTDLWLFRPGPFFLLLTHQFWGLNVHFLPHLSEVPWWSYNQIHFTCQWLLLYAWWCKSMLHICSSWKVTFRCESVLFESKSIHLYIIYYTFTL